MPRFIPPPEPVAPKIETVPIVRDGQVYIGMKTQDGLRLYEYLEQEQAFTKILLKHIEAMNDLLQRKQ